MKVWATIAKTLEEHGSCAMVSIVEVEGSAPREVGARLLVTPRGYHGTIGGGALEWQALARTQARLGKGPSVELSSQALGPELGQCCGGRVRLLTEVFDRSQLPSVQALAAEEQRRGFSTVSRILTDRVERSIAPAGKPPAKSAFIESFGERRRPLYLFGAGHVGRALVLALAQLPFDIRWIDSRPDAFPSASPRNVTTVFSSAPPSELGSAPDQSFVLVMTHSHPLDLAIVEKALREGRFGYVGLIGSATKRARFASQLRAGGIDETALASLVCPIGIGGITGKQPAIIATAAAAELLQRDELLRSAENPVARADQPSKMTAGRS
jgi:xanthine dehydrogenase accessory factor